MAAFNETTVHLPEQNIDVTLRVDYLDQVAVDTACYAKLDELGVDGRDEQRALPWSYTITKRTAVVRTVPKGWTWKNADDSPVPLSEATINRLPLKDVKVLADACMDLYNEVDAAMRSLNDPKDSPSTEQ